MKNEIESLFDRRVVFAPHLRGKKPEVVLVLECGHSVDWGDSQVVPSFVPCASCRLDEEGHTKARH